MDCCVPQYDMHFWDDYTCLKTSQGNVCSPAEASIRELTAGVVEYQRVVPVSKLVLGLPWYGQRYVQLGVPINYGQIDYKEVLAAFDAGLVTNRQFDKNALSWKIDCRGSCLPGKKGSTVWYDDATTLAPKFRLAGQHGLRGVGMWKVDDLPTAAANGSDPHADERHAMWAAIRGWDNVSSSGSSRSSLGSSPWASTPGVPPGVPPLVATLYQSSQTVVNPARQKPDRLTPYKIIFNASSAELPTAPTIVLSTPDVRQTIVGFGGAITDAVAHVFNSMPAVLQEEAIEAIWGTSGQMYNMARMTIGATDFSTTVYNYNDQKGDLEQQHFSVQHDEAQIIPMAKRASRSAQAAGHALEFLASPWSPPGWMKRGWLTPHGYMRNSAKPGMIDDEKVFASYALYTSKYLSEYKKHGINISRITIQNEPDSADHMVVATYPACNFNGTGEGRYLKDHLGPRIREDHPEVQIYVHDGQKFHDVPIRTRVEEILAAAGHSQAREHGRRSYVDGVAFHWYGKNLDNYEYLGDLATSHPELKLLATEATLRDPRTQKDTWAQGQMYGIDIIGDLNNGAEGWIEWNVLLDSTGGPTCIGPTVTTACVPQIGHCDAPLLYDVAKKALVYRDTYHIMGHFSRYIRRNARVVKTSIHEPAGDQMPSTTSASPLQVVAVAQPDSDSGRPALVIVVLNPSANNVSVAYKLDLGDGHVAALSAPPRSIQTIVVPSTKESDLS